MLHSSVSDLGLHCLQMSLLLDARLKQVKIDLSRKKGKTIHCAQSNITKTYLYNFDPLYNKPHFYIVKLGFTRVYIIFLVSAQKHRLWVPIRTHNLCFEQKYEKYRIFFI